MLTATLAEVRRICPHLTIRSRAIVEAILFVEGSVGSMAALSGRLGLRNRFALERLLKRDGVPSLRRLVGLVTVLSWVKSAERDGVSLCHLAFRQRRYPSACYRLVREATGHRWEEVRKHGSHWVELRLLEEFRRMETLTPLTQPRGSR